MILLMFGSIVGWSIDTPAVRHVVPDPRTDGTPHDVRAMEIAAISVATFNDMSLSRMDRAHSHHDTPRLATRYCAFNTAWNHSSQKLGGFHIP